MEKNFFKNLKEDSHGFQSLDGSETDGKFVLVVSHTLNMQNKFKQRLIILRGFFNF